MKKKKNLRLTLNKKKVSELSNVSQQKIVGGQSYPCNYGGGGSGGSGDCSNNGHCGGTNTCMVYCNPSAR